MLGAERVRAVSDTAGLVATAMSVVKAQNT
jgi:hypothetical protein